MELTLESALSVNGVLGHVSYLLLIVSMLMVRMLYLRIFVTLSALAGISYDALILHDPVGLFWEIALLIVSLVQISLLYRRDRRASFAPHEATLLDRYFTTLPRGEQRRLLDYGSWRNLPPGTVLTVEGEPVPALTYLASGEVCVIVQARRVTDRGAGSLVGELTVATAAPATATVTLTTTALVWQLDAAKFRWLIGRRPHIGSALQAGCFRAVCDKLAENDNRHLAATSQTEAPQSVGV